MESTHKANTPSRPRRFVLRPPNEVIDVRLLERAIEARDPNWRTARYDHPLPRRASVAFEIAQEIFG